MKWQDTQGFNWDNFEVRGYLVVTGSASKCEVVGVYLSGKILRGNWEDIQSQRLLIGNRDDNHKKIGL